MLSNPDLNPQPLKGSAHPQYIAPSAESVRLAQQIEAIGLDPEWVALTPIVLSKLAGFLRNDGQDQLADAIQLFV